MYPPNGSASADTSGTSRQSPELAPHGWPLLNELMTPGPVCQDGIDHTCEIPPPPAPSPNAVSFHTLSVGGGPTEARVVPPTDVVNGCEPRSEVASPVLPS